MVRNSNARLEEGSTRSKRREALRRQSILRAAAQAFRSRGFAATGMRDIAAAADLSPGNLYYYFGSKQDLLYFCQDESLDRLLASCAEIAGADFPAPEKLERIVRAHVSCTLGEIEGSAAHLEVDALGAEERRRIVEKRDRYERAVRSVVEDGVHSGQFAPCDTRLVTRAILGALNWTARWWDPDGPTTTGALADSFARFLVRGLLP